MSTLSQIVPFLGRLPLQGRLAYNHIPNPLLRSYSANKRCDPNMFRQPHMNELPIACHDFQQHYKKTQRAYNIILIAGILSFGSACFLMNWLGCLELYLTPCEPAPPTPLLEGKPRKEIKEPKCD